MVSVFSKIISGELPSYKIAENDGFLAFLDVFPLKEGHVLIVPKKEVDYIFDMDDSDLEMMMVFAKQIAKKIEIVMPCRRIGVTVIGLEVPHAHIHLIPINGVADMDFTRPKLTLSPERLSEIAAAIRNA